MLKDKHGFGLQYQIVDQARKGDHICYYSDLAKLKSHYPQFQIRMSLDSILKEMVENATTKEKRAA